MQRILTSCNEYILAKYVMEMVYLAYINEKGWWYMKVSEKLLNIRKEKALSQSEVAEKLGISRQTLSKWENGVSHS